MSEAMHIGIVASPLKAIAFCDVLSRAHNGIERLNMSRSHLDAKYQDGSLVTSFDDPLKMRGNHFDELWCEESPNPETDEWSAFISVISGQQDRIHYFRELKQECDLC